MNPQKFWARTAPGDGGCVLWMGAVKPNGYGHAYVGIVDGKKRNGYAHRVAYELSRGPIPDGLHIDHLCRNRRCVNPLHLEAVTNRENVLRGEGWSGRKARQTHCVNGHEFTPENTYLRKRSGRACRTCLRDFQRRRADERERRLGVRSLLKAQRVEAGEPARNLARKLSEDAVRDIRADFRAGFELALIARHYGVSPGQVRNIVTGKHWAHLADLAVSP